MINGETSLIFSYFLKVTKSSLSMVVI